VCTDSHHDGYITVILYNSIPKATHLKIGKALHLWLYIRIPITIVTG